MQTVVCFGDSNTWGYDPARPGERFDRSIRWPALLAAELADEWEVISEGLNGRTATLDSPVAEGRNGLTYLLPCLHSHAPVDLVIIFLGTNDVSDRYWLPPATIAWSVGRLVGVVRTSEAGPGDGAPDVLVVCPPPLGRIDPDSEFAHAGERSEQLSRHFAEMCTELGCELLDLRGVASYSDLDAHHFEPDGHAAVAAAVLERIRARPAPRGG
jgi:lysophospholipase L1-like esterase